MNEPTMSEISLSAPTSFRAPEATVQGTNLPSKALDHSDVETLTSKTIALSVSMPKDIEKSEPKYPSPSKMDCPDGGFGWLVVFGAFMIQFCCWGFNFSWGVYQQYYLEDNIFPGATLSQISWAGGIGTASAFLTCPFQSSMVRRFGLRPVIAVGILISGCGIILASFANSLWQLFLTQGVLFGLGAGMAIFPSIAVPVQWFDRKRGLAAGITVAGSGLGGACLAPLNRQMITRLGYQWTLRIMGISVIVVVVSVLFCIRTRIVLGRSGGGILELSLFKERGFTAIYLMGMFVAFGYLVPVFLLPEFVTGLGMDPSTGATLVGVFAGVNAVSRIILGLIADRYGALNVLILTTTFTSLSCFIFWLNAKGLVMTIVFVVIYGFNCGGFNSLFPVVAADLMGLEKLATAVGLLYSGNLFGNLLGVPIASALVAASGGSYTWAMVFAGTMPIIAASLLVPIRYRINARIFVRV
ncbi:hypothetical protein BGX28_001110 [Mortierella sp. GBA30]|nr:hypothetical protein BGX28_001110 [Mortierella sp. GBA30]